MGSDNSKSVDPRRALKYCKEVDVLCNCKLIDRTEEICMNALISATNIMDELDIDYVILDDGTIIHLSKIYELIPKKYKTDKMRILILLLKNVKIEFARDVANEIENLNIDIINAYIEKCIRYYNIRLEQLNDMKLKSYKVESIKKHIIAIKFEDSALIKELAFKIGIEIDLNKYFGFVDKYL